MMHNDIVPNRVRNFAPRRAPPPYTGIERRMLVAAATASDMFTKAVAATGPRSPNWSASTRRWYSASLCTRLRDAALAEELAQEVFLDLYNHLSDLQSAAHVEFWLRKVASRRCIDYVRRRATGSRTLLGRRAGVVERSGGAAIRF